MYLAHIILNYTICTYFKDDTSLHNNSKEYGNGAVSENHFQNFKSSAELLKEIAFQACIIMSFMSGKCCTYAFTLTFLVPCDAMRICH